MKYRYKVVVYNYRTEIEATCLCETISFEHVNITVPLVTSQNDVLKCISPLKKIHLQ